MPKMPAIRDEGGYIREYTLASGQTFLEGAFVVLADGEVSECGADPATILGFALADAGNLPETGKILVLVFEAGCRFWIQGSASPAAADVGDAYGVVKDGDGIWTLDKTETVNTRLEVVDVDTTRNMYLVTPKVANVQFST